jgi:hypothetical protein
MLKTAMDTSAGEIDAFAALIRTMSGRLSR